MECCNGQDLYIHKLWVGARRARGRRLIRRHCWECALVGARSIHSVPREQGYTDDTSEENIEGRENRWKRCDGGGHVMGANVNADLDNVIT